MFDNSDIGAVSRYITGEAESPKEKISYFWEKLSMVSETEEKISYQMPTYYLHGNLVHFVAHKNHIGFYSTPIGIEAFKDKLSNYKSEKGSVQFPIDKSISLNLIRKIVEFRVRKTEKNLRKK